MLLGDATGQAGADRAGGNVHRIWRQTARHTLWTQCHRDQRVVVGKGKSAPHHRRQAQQVARQCQLPSAPLSAPDLSHRPAPSGLTWLFIAACAVAAWVVGYGLGYRRGAYDTINGSPSKPDHRLATRKVVSVEDTGKGVEPSAADRIFSPLFTTKAHGMGMGLSICRSIVEAHEGRLWATANLPRGAIFHFTVPAHPEVDPESETVG
jgi:hypothetical protein